MPSTILLTFLEIIIFFMIVVALLRVCGDVILIKMYAQTVVNSILLIFLDLAYYLDSNTFDYNWKNSVTIFADYNLTLGLDGLGLVFGLLTTFIVPLCIFSTDSADLDLSSFILYLLLLEIFLILSFLVTNLFFFYFFFESVLIPMFLLMGKWGSHYRRITAAYYFFLYTLFGSFFLLFGIFYLYTICGTTDYSILFNIDFNQNEQLLLWWLFFIPFAIKTPIFPWHIWLPEAHVEAPTIGSILLASLLLKLGGYGLLRFVIDMFPLACETYSIWLHFLALSSIIFASLSTIIQTDLKRLIAYSSIAHMNLIVLGIFTLNAQSLSGANYLMISHGIVSAGLFFSVGIVYARYRSRDILYYSGLFQLMPIFSTSFFLFTLSNMSFPGTSNFIGEFLIFVGLFDTTPIILLFAAVSIILSAIYSIWVFNRFIFGVLKSHNVRKNYADVIRSEFLILIILIVSMIILGIQSRFINDLLNNFTKTRTLTTF